MSLRLALARLVAAPMFTIFSVLSLASGVAITTAKIEECCLARLKFANNCGESVEPSSFRSFKRRITVRG